jgi:hypothetical protein
VFNDQWLITEVTTKKCENVGYNKAALAFIEAKGNDAKNLRPKAISVVIATYVNDKLLLPCHNFA